MVSRPASFPGAGLLSFLILLLPLSGCGRAVGGGADAAVEDVESLGLPSGAQLHRITLGGRGSEEHAVPTLIQAEPGDGVEFRTVDHRVHTLTFPADSLSPEVLAFLDSTGQMASPPLVTRGSRFIVRLQNAPPGRYFFVSEGHGGTARGVIEVGPLPPPDSSRIR
jgi:plastocyanin